MRRISLLLLLFIVGVACFAVTSKTSVYRYTGISIDGPDIVVNMTQDGIPFEAARLVIHASGEEADTEWTEVDGSFSGISADWSVAMSMDEFGNWSKSALNVSATKTICFDVLGNTSSSTQVIYAPYVKVDFTDYPVDEIIPIDGGYSAVWKHVYGIVDPTVEFTTSATVIDVTSGIDMSVYRRFRNSTNGSASNFNIGIGYDKLIIDGSEWYDQREEPAKEPAMFSPDTIMIYDGVWYGSNTDSTASRTIYSSYTSSACVIVNLRGSIAQGTIDRGNYWRYQTVFSDRQITSGTWEYDYNLSSSSDYFISVRRDCNQNNGTDQDNWWVFFDNDTLSSVETLNNYVYAEILLDATYGITYPWGYATRDSTNSYGYMVFFAYATGPHADAPALARKHNSGNFSYQNQFLDNAYTWSYTADEEVYYTVYEIVVEYGSTTGREYQNIAQDVWNPDPLDGTAQAGSLTGATLITDSTADFNSDGFSEGRGWYTLSASTNEVIVLFDSRRGGVLSATNSFYYPKFYIENLGLSASDINCASTDDGGSSWNTLVDTEDYQVVIKADAVIVSVSDTFTSSGTYGFKFNDVSVQIHPEYQSVSEMFRDLSTVEDIHPEYQSEAEMWRKLADDHPTWGLHPEYQSEAEMFKLLKDNGGY